MISNFLTNTNWLTPQLDFLLYLQNIRNYCSYNLDTFFLSITIFGEYLIPFLISAIIYWCIDTKKGVYLFSICALNIFIVQLIKMTACIYRPWGLSSKFHPSVKAISHAGGYSFPSGHSAFATTFLGGLSVILKKYKFICLGLIMLILLVCFSRMFLGVHTPQDVVCGFLIGIFLIFATIPLINWLESDKKRYLYILILIDIIVFLIFVYILNKPYSIDYLNNKILVLPHRAIYNSLISCGLASGIINGLCLFRSFFNYEPKKFSNKKRITIGIIGVICTYFLMNLCIDKCFITEQTYTQISLKTFFTGLFITFIYPLIWQTLVKNLSTRLLL